MCSYIILLIAFLLLLLSTNANRSLFQINEETPIGTELSEVSKFLKIHFKFFKSSSSFSLIGEEKFTRTLTIDSSSMKMMVKSRIDRETLCPMIRSSSTGMNMRTNNNKCLKSVRVINNKESVYLDFEIMDINDHAPQWNITGLLKLNIVENRTKKSIKIPLAEDKDSDSNGIITYRLQPRNMENRNFILHYQNQQILLLTPLQKLDYEFKTNYTIILIAEDMGTPKLTSSLIVKIQVLDINDNAPVFTQSIFRPIAPIKENCELNSIILTVKATDRDSGINSKISYSLDPSVRLYVRNQFYLDPYSGELKLKSQLDFDKGYKFYKFTIVATDGTNEPYKLSSSATVEILVADINDEIPEIQLYFIVPHTTDPLTGVTTGEISENLAAEYFDIAHININDADEVDLSFVHCTLDRKSDFKLIPDNMKMKSFTLAAVKSFDRELSSIQRLKIGCEDKGGNVDTKFVNIKILDVNDNAPRFERIFYFAIEENQPRRYQSLGRIHATDADLGVNAKLKYEIQLIEPLIAQEFRINSNTGELFAERKLDREIQDHYNITVMAIDHGTPKLTGTGYVIINVLDVNDCPPVFSSLEYKFSIPESTEINTKVGVVEATDGDIKKNAQIRYHLIRESFGFQRSSNMEGFYIDSRTGVITTAKKLDREKTASYLLTIEAMNNGIPRSFSATTTVEITIEDVNDNAPLFYSPANLSVITINTEQDIGSEVKQFLAKDKDENNNGVIMYKIVHCSDPYLFNLDITSGIMFLSKKVHQFNDYKLIVQACDQGTPKLCSKKLNILISTTTLSDVSRSMNNHNPNIRHSGDFDMLNKNRDRSRQDSSNNSGIFITESNGAIIACLVVIFMILIMAMVVMFFLIRNKHIFSKRRDEDDKCTSPDINGRHSEYGYSKKESNSIYEGDFLLLNERNKMNNLLMQNSTYSPKVYGDNRLINLTQTNSRDLGDIQSCYRTVDPNSAGMGNSIYNPVLLISNNSGNFNNNVPNNNIDTESVNHYSTQQTTMGSTEPAYRYSNISLSAERNSISPELQHHHLQQQQQQQHQYNQQAQSSTPAPCSNSLYHQLNNQITFTTLRRNNNNPVKLAPSHSLHQHEFGDQSNVIVNFDSQTMPRSVSLIKFYEKQSPNLRQNSNNHDLNDSQNNDNQIDEDLGANENNNNNNNTNNNNNNNNNSMIIENVDKINNRCYKNVNQNNITNIREPKSNDANTRPKYAYEALREGSFI